MAGTVHIIDPIGWSDRYAARLREVGFVVLRVHDRESAERQLWRRPADQITIVDAPGKLDTAGLLALLRESQVQVNAPLTVVAAPQDEERFLSWFAAGADDVIESDCRPVVFVARVRAPLRRAGGLP
ncbi:MAG: response regulator transcription factor, partial [Dehalococcoidia bacterium]